MSAQTPEALYLSTARRMSAELMRRYSSSFTAASLLLGEATRYDIASVYALVRVADEIVDSGAVDAHERQTATARLDALHEGLAQAKQDQFSVNPVLHAYQEAARRLNIAPEWEDAFFRSMRADVTEPISLRDYVYGSAEVVGLMCVHCFLGGPPREQRDAIYDGARGLGRAFQNVNFLRDARADHDELGRDYLGLYQHGHAGDLAKQIAEDGVRRDLDKARAAIPLLPRHARAAVAAATGLFADVEARVEARSLDQLIHGPRIHVPSARKALIVSAAIAAHPSLRGKRHP